MKQSSKEILGDEISMYINVNSKACDNPDLMHGEPPIPIYSYMIAKPSPPVPKTSSGMIGWRSSSDTYKLDKFFKRQIQGNIFKRMDWPIES